MKELIGRHYVHIYFIYILQVSRDRNCLLIEMFIDHNFRKLKDHFIGTLIRYLANS